MVCTKHFRCQTTAVYGQQMFFGRKENYIDFQFHNFFAEHCSFHDRVQQPTQLDSTPRPYYSQKQSLHCTTFAKTSFYTKTSKRTSPNTPALVN